MTQKFHPLSAGSTIGIVCPSYPYAVALASRYHRAIAELKRLKYSVKVGQYVTTHEGVVTGTPEQRAQDINQFFADKTVRAILCVNGGTLAAEVLPYLNYELIRANPKFLIGYSDITAVLIGIYAKTGIPTIQGPMLIPQFGEYPSVLEYTHQSFLNATQSVSEYTITASTSWTDEFLDSRTGADLERPRRQVPNKGWKVARSGVASGTLLSGNIRILCSLLGTPYAPTFSNSILVLEDLHIKTDELQRNLIHLKQAGAFSSARAVLFGRILALNLKDTLQIEQVFENVFGEYNFPIVYDIDFGHTDPVATIVNGANATLDTQNATLKVESIIRSK